jgi:hypothetical protein
LGRWNQGNMLDNKACDASEGGATDEHSQEQERRRKIAEHILRELSRVGVRARLVRPGHVAGREGVPSW